MLVKVIVTDEKDEVLLQLDLNDPTAPTAETLALIVMGHLERYFDVREKGEEDGTM